MTCTTASEVTDPLRRELADQVLAAPHRYSKAAVAWAERMKRTPIAELGPGA